MPDATATQAPLFLPEMLFWSVAGAMAAALAVTIALSAVDPRTIDGGTVWAKPIKFELALGLHAATLALVMSALSGPVRASSVMTAVALAFLVASIFEMGYIIFQAARAEHSHFNLSTPFHRIMWSMMGIAALVIIGAAGAIGAVALAGSDDELTLTTRWAIAVGLIGGTVLTVYTAGTIGARLSPYVGAVPLGDAQRMPFTGWSIVAGDLRVSHFLATHMIQIVPLAGLVVALAAPGRAGAVAVITIATAWCAITHIEYRRALDGEPSPLAVIASRILS